MLSLAQAQENLACIGAPTDGHVFVPSSLSCNHYIVCMNGLTHLDTCTPGDDFNVIRQECNPAGTVDCTQCGNVGSLNLPDANNCGSYFECRFGTRTHRNCPAGSMFDRTIGYCNVAHLVNCPGVFPTESPYSTTTPSYPGITPPGPITTASPRPVCVPGGPVVHPHPSNCRRYFVCVNNILMENECLPNFHWNERTSACDTPQNAQCFRESNAENA